jgi:SAM-dependent methyltransferase
MRFTDHFAPVSAAYADFRPGYPKTLFKWLAEISPDHRLAWDCATGSGQAAVDLAEHFTHVVATDASESQLAAAIPRPGVDYRLAAAEASGLPDGAVDLVTVAQALHWLDLPRFYAEARRVLRPDGILAAWCYGVFAVDDESVNARIQRDYHEIIADYWPEERRHVDEGYRSLAFPFAEIRAPSLHMTASWTLERLLGYLQSWSATARYRAEQSTDPIEGLRIRLAPVWGHPETRRAITWPLSFRVGRVGTSE